MTITWSKIADPPRAEFIRGGVITLLLVAAVVAFYAITRVGEVDTPPDSMKFDRALLCDDASCTSGQEVTLPYRLPAQAAEGLIEVYLRLVLHDLPPEGPRMIFVPRAHRVVQVLINGQITHATRDLELRQWNRAGMTPIESAIRPEGPNILDIRLTGYAQEGLELWPVFIGPENTMALTWIATERRGIGMALLAQLLTTALFFGHLVVYRALANAEPHLWMAAASACAFVFLLHYSSPPPPLDYALWTKIWTTAPALYTYCLMKFELRLLNRSYPLLENSFALWIGICVIVGIALPDAYALIYGAVINTGNVVFGTAILAIFYAFRHVLGRGAAMFLLACFLVALANGVFEIILVFAPFPVAPQTMLHFSPILIAFVAIWLFLTQMIVSMREVEDRANTLQAIVAQKTAELEASYDALARSRARDAIEEERSRILLDLHDGIGGHLANTLAYLENHHKGDEVIKTALEDAMRDLALMLDSLENDDSVATLLGMMRERLEPLLRDHNLHFDWQVIDEPLLPKAGPSQNLGLARIVQEAITNTIKHAKARRVRIFADDRIVEVSDDGQGFDLDEGLARRSHGLLSMRRRAEILGIDLEIITKKGKGTIVRLDLSKGSARRGEKAANGIGAR